MSIELSTVVREYWKQLFHTGERLPSDAGLTVVVNPDLDAQRRVMIMEDSGVEVHVVLSPDVAAAAGFCADASRTLSQVALRDALQVADIRLHAPDLLYYAPAQAPTPGLPKANVQLRQIGTDDARAFNEFSARASEQDKEAAFVELDHWAVFGAFDGSELLAAASMYPWGGAAIADMGVLTLPQARGAGLGRALIGAMAAHAHACGYQLQYRCQHDNHASIALARSSGLLCYGRWEVACEA